MKIQFGGKEWESVSQLARVFGRKPHTVLVALQCGKSLADALHGGRGTKYLVGDKEYNTTSVAKLLGVQPATIRYRKAKGWSKDEILTFRAYDRKLTAWGRSQSLNAWCREKNIARSTVRRRLQTMSLELALTIPPDPRMRRCQEATHENP